MHQDETLLRGGAEMIKLTCPSCSALVTASESDRGYTIACSSCGERIHVPDDDSTLDDELDADERMLGLDALSDGELDGDMW